MACRRRADQEQSLHDRAAKDIANARFDESKNDVYVNPDGEKNAYVGPEDHPTYPDIVVLVKGTGHRTAVAIGEVETSSSVDKDEADQWKEYGETGIPFYLYIPAGYSQRAKED